MPLVCLSICKTQGTPAQSKTIGPILVKVPDEKSCSNARNFRKTIIRRKSGQICSNYKMFASTKIVSKIIKAAPTSEKLAP